MPVMGGLEATRLIRKLEQTTNRKPVPIVGLSGNARSSQVSSAVEMGMDGYLTKPVHRDQIYEILTRYIDQDGSSATTPVPDQEIEFIPSSIPASFTLTKYIFTPSEVPDGLPVTGSFNEWLQRLRSGDG